MKRVYLDNAATTPLAPEVIEVMHSAMKENYGNPSSIHALGRESRTLIEQARKTISKLLDVSPGEIFFTSGGTEADNTVLSCGARDLGIQRIITSAIEHHAVLYSAQRLEEAKLAQVEYVKLDDKGTVDYEHLRELLSNDNQKTLVTLMHANNEIGNLTDLVKTGAICKEYGAYFHSDTVQTIGHLPVDLKSSQLDFISASAHKFNGPKGIGFMYINSSNKMKPFIQGGSQERNMRGGTENIYGIIGMAKAMEMAWEEMDEMQAKLQGLKSYMMDRLREEIPDIGFRGETDPDKSLYTVLNVSFPPGDVGDMLLFSLDIKGIYASGGSACSSGSDVGSHVIRALPAEPGRISVRFSFGKYNTRDEIDYTISQLKEILNVKTLV
ncbi:MAG: cysteine desulfurase family protein [Bacteroidia bacterium]